MNHKRPPFPAIIIILLLIAVSVYFIITQTTADENGALTASGSIESVTVNVAPELAGKVIDVLVEEGQTVTANDALLLLDDSQLEAERGVAQAALDAANAGVQTAQVALASAQLQYNVILNNALAQDASSRLAIWDESKPAEFDQPIWYFSKQERIKAAQAQVEAARTALNDAMTKLDEVSGRAGSSDFLDVEATLAGARIAFQNAQDVLDNTSGASDSQGLRDAAQIVLDEAQIDLDDAQKDYDDALTTEGAADVLEARADAIIAQEIYDSAVDKLRALQTGSNSLQVQTAEKGVAQADAMLAQAQANVKSAQARLNAVDVQLAKITMYAPMDGVVMVRNVETGEFVQPGASAFSIADLNNLTITVYVPEDQYGSISLGQEATLTVDSFPGETFDAVVVHIADQAEFTPRNVQTVEGRSSTVYAIKLKVTDSDGKLKIGMPADVVFK